MVNPFQIHGNSMTIKSTIKIHHFQYQMVNPFGPETRTPPRWTSEPEMTDSLPS